MDNIVIGGGDANPIIIAKTQHMRAFDPAHFTKVTFKKCRKSRKKGSNVAVNRKEKTGK